jgi:hypothetical protein
MKLSFLMICLLFVAVCCLSQPPQFNKVIENNGLKGNLQVHDPVMIKAGDTYYIPA